MAQDAGRTDPGVRTGLDAKVQHAVQLMDPCHLCFRRCGVRRLQGETGFCGIKQGGNIVLEAVLCGEEEIVNPTYEVFLAGCNLRCGFCYESRWIEDPGSVLEVESGTLADRIARTVPIRASNVHWVGGEPSVHLPWIVSVLRDLSAPVPVVWNSNMLMTDEALEILTGIPDLILADIHFGCGECADAMSGFAGYFNWVKRQILKCAGKVDMIIRHLFLPGHFECCYLPIAEWIAENCPTIPFHVMPQYVPPSRMKMPIPDRRTRPDEIERAVETAKLMKLNVMERPFIPGGGPAGTPGFETEIEIFQDGTVAIRNFSGDFIDMVRFLQSGETDTGRFERTSDNRDR